MTAYEYVKSNNIKIFYCQADKQVDYVHGIHGGAAGSYFPINLCLFNEQKKDGGFPRFSNCEVVAISAKWDGTPILYVKMTKKKLVDDLTDIGYKNIKIIKMHNVIPETAKQIRN